MTVNPDDSLSDENMPGFRDWFIQRAPAIAASANLIPGEGGLNIEGLAWDHERHALLFGVRTPLSANCPLVIPVCVKDLAAPWTTANLKMLPPIRILLDPAGGARGIRSIEYIASRHAFLVVVGKTISGGKAPFALYEWKGGRRGKLRRLNVSFAGKMKPEGVTSGTVGGKPALLFVDEGGDYRALWLDLGLADCPVFEDRHGVAGRPDVRVGMSNDCAGLALASRTLTAHPRVMLSIIFRKGNG